MDVRSAAVPIRLDQDLLHHLPTPRALHALLNLVPGISSDVAFGGSQMSNEILVEGVRTTDPSFQEPVLDFNVNWVQEINVVALGAGAEHDGFTGSAGTSILRSGGNRFSGLAEYWTTRPGWLSRNTGGLEEALQQQFNSRELLDWWDGNAQLGGPVVEDRLWFFTGLQLVLRKRYSRDWQMQASYTWSKDRGTVGNRWHVNAARFDLGSPGRFVNPNLGINAFGRATFDPTHEVKLLGTYRAPVWGGITTSAFYRYTTGQAWGRRATVRGLRQGQQAIRIEPQGTRRLDAINKLDLRVEKRSRLGGAAPWRACSSTC